jgi:Carboxypeptidase regulatory-like domain
VQIMSRVWTLVAAAGLLVTVSSAAAAQTGAVLSGVVQDRTGAAVSGVVLTVVDPVRSETRVVITDDRGTYFVDRLHYGFEYMVHVSHPRFRKSHVRASANEGETPVRITLAPPRPRLVSAVLFPLRVLSFGRLGTSSAPRYQGSSVERSARAVRFAAEDR